LPIRCDWGQSPARLGDREGGCPIRSAAGQSPARLDNGRADVPSAATGDSHPPASIMGGRMSHPQCLGTVAPPSRPWEGGCPIRSAWGQSPARLDNGRADVPSAVLGAVFANWSQALTRAECLFAVVIGIVSASRAAERFKF